MYAYNEYQKNYCICIIYERNISGITIKHIILNEKWKLASKSKGSGNTTNIGSNI